MSQEIYMWIVFGLTFLSMILYSIDKIRMEVISLFSIVVLLLIFQNSPILGVSSGGAINIILLLPTKYKNNKPSSSAAANIA